MATRTSVWTEGFLIVVILVLSTFYIIHGLAEPRLIDTSHFASTAQVSNQSTTQNLTVEISQQDCTNGSLQTGTQSVPQTSSQTTSSSTQATSGLSQASPSELQTRATCNSSSQTTPLQPAGSKTDFEQFDNQ